MQQLHCAVKQAQVLISKTSSSMTNTLKSVRLFTSNWNIQNMLFVEIYFSSCWFWKLLYCKRQGDVCYTSLPESVKLRYGYKCLPHQAFRKQELQVILIRKTLSREPLALAGPRSSFIPDLTQTQTLWKYMQRVSSGKDSGALRDVWI